MKARRPKGSSRTRANAASMFASEAELQNAIVNYLWACDWYVIVTDAGEAARASRQRHRRGKMRPGVPDITALKNGRGMLLEVKLPGRNLTRRQELEHRYIAEFGVPVYVVRSIEDVQRAIEEVERGERIG